MTAPTAPPAAFIDITGDQLPNLDDKSLQFLKTIVKNDLSQLEFDDELEIYSLRGQKIGDFEIRVKPTTFKRRSCFKVIAKSYGVLEEAPCGTEITAYIDENLRTLDQQYHEFIMLPQGKLDRKVSMILEGEEYKIVKTETNGNDVKRLNYRVKINLMDGFVSESSNILLQRLMVQNNRYETVSLFTFDTDLNACPANYRPLDSRIVNIDEDGIKTRGIERTVDSISDIPTTWQIYFSQDGHMINRVQIGYPAVMRVTKRPPAIEIDEYLEKPVIEKKSIDWEKDMQLKSIHLDKKESYKNDYDQYMFDHPELKALVADFTQSILSQKPDDTVAFAARFFAPYSAKTKNNKFLLDYKEQVNIPRH